MNDIFKSSERLNGIAISDIVQIKQRSDALVRQGRDIIDLSIGEPDFPTPEHILVAATEAMRGGATHYTATAGTLALRSAIARKVARDNHRTVGTDQIMVGVGAKQVLANALLATLDPGDEVIIPTPFWPNYVDIVKFSGGTPILVPGRSTDGFLLSPHQLEAAITPKTKWLILNSPSNPTGACYTKDALIDIAAVLERRRHVSVIEDAIYEHIIFDGKPYNSILDVSPALLDRVLWVNGVSKAYAMTGWRIGYGIGPRPLIDAMVVISAQTTSHPCSIAQSAAIAAFDGDQGPVVAFRETFERRRDVICAALAAIPGVLIMPPPGAFYIFADMTGFINNDQSSGMFEDDRALANYLLEQAGVAVVPGTAFGAPGFIRISFATSEEQLRDAGSRIISALV